MVLALASMLACSHCEDEIGVLAENNYAFAGDLQIESVTIGQNVDVLIDWSSLSKDLQGHDVDPVETVDMVALANFRYLSIDEVTQGMSDDSLEQADLGVFVFAEVAEATSINISELTLFGTDAGIVNYLAPEYGTFVLMASHGTTPAVGVLQATFIEPDPESDVSGVSFSDTSTVLTFDADIAGLQAIVVPADGAFTLDWTDLATDSRGLPIEHGDIDQILVARYEDLGVSDLEENFLDIELLADDVWTYDVYAGSTADLSELGLPSIDDGATWLAAGRCTTCSNPAPKFLTLLDVCSED